MKTKRLHLTLNLLLIVALAGAALLAPQTAYAQSGGGTGTLTASGDGLAGMRGNGTVTISGSGVLWIRDHNGDAAINVTGNGERRELPSGWIRYVGFSGEATVTGSKITVALSGYGISLTATGTGKFLLRGEGTFSTERRSGTWSDQGVIIKP